MCITTYSLNKWSTSQSIDHTTHIGYTAKTSKSEMVLRTKYVKTKSVTHFNKDSNPDLRMSNRDIGRWT